MNTKIYENKMEEISLQKIRIKNELKNVANVLYDFENNTFSFSFNKNYYIDAIITENYPFHPPIVYVNKNKINYNSKMFPIRLYNLYLSYYGCPCCSSIVCNWSPSYSIKDVLNEYFLFIDKMKIFHKLIYLNKSKLPKETILEIKSYIL